MKKIPIFLFIFLCFTTIIIGNNPAFASTNLYIDPLMIGSSSYSSDFLNKILIDEGVTEPNYNVYFDYNHPYSYGGWEPLRINGSIKTDAFATPNHTNMSGLFPNEIIKYYIIEWFEDFPDTVKEDIKKSIEEDEIYSSVKYISEATTQYNCHSFAWYSRDYENNHIWLQYPNIYFSEGDKSYVEVSEPRIGDIICYIDENADSIEKSHIHSGIIVGLSGEEPNGICGDANKYIVQSKWSLRGLYEHRGDICPDVLGGETGDAESVKYYRLRTDGAREMSAGMPSNLDAFVKNVLSRDSVAQSGGSKEATYSMYELNVNEAGKYSITVTASSPLSIYFLDVNRNTYSITPTVTEGDNYTYKFVSDFDVGYYYVRSEFESSSASGNIITQVKHEHTFDLFDSVNDEYHVEKCACGVTGVMRSHVIKADGTTNRYKPCAYCGHIIDTRSDIIIPIIRNKFSDTVTE